MQQAIMVNSDLEARLKFREYRMTDNTIGIFVSRKGKQWLLTEYEHIADAIKAYEDIGFTLKTLRNY